jgi:hypothetical protein
MGRRRIGQQRLSIGDQRRGTSLDETSALIEWAEIDRHWSISTQQPKVLALFRAMLLAV